MESLRFWPSKLAYSTMYYVSTCILQVFSDSWRLLLKKKRQAPDLQNLVLPSGLAELVFGHAITVPCSCFMMDPNIQVSLRPELWLWSHLPTVLQAPWRMPAMPNYGEWSKMLLKPIVSLLTSQEIYIQRYINTKNTHTHTHSTSLTPFFNNFFCVFSSIFSALHLFMSWNWEDEADEEHEDFEDELSEEGSLSWHLGNSEKKHPTTYSRYFLFFLSQELEAFLHCLT